VPKLTRNVVPAAEQFTPGYDSYTNSVRDSDESQIAERRVNVWWRPAWEDYLGLPESVNDD